MIIHRSRFLHGHTASCTSARHPLVLLVVPITAALALTRRGVPREAPRGVYVVFITIIIIVVVIAAAVVVFEKVAIDVP
jgi:prepilin signal peptidase PulO-like enzyme (type II secretory pathway)